MSSGLSLANTNYEKAMRFNYESTKLFAVNANLALKFKNFLSQANYKNLPAQVQSSQGNLNIYGWKYRHQWVDFGLGYLLNKRHHLYLKGAYHYSPMLFPTQVGVFQSEAAFEQISLFAYGLGYKTFLKVFSIPVKTQFSFYAMGLNDPDYSLKYGLAWNLQVTPYYQWKNFRFGLTYDYLGQVLSLRENKTGQDYPFKSFIRLHQLLMSLEVHLH